MKRFTGNWKSAKAVAALLAGLVVQSAPAQTKAPRQHDWPVMPLAASVTNGNVVFFWPKQTSPTDLEAKPAGGGKGIWQPVPDTAYHTNDAFITATVPLTDEAMLYRLRRRRFSRRSPLNAALPPLPSPPAITNHPAGLKPASP